MEVTDICIFEESGLLVSEIDKDKVDQCVAEIMPFSEWPLVLSGQLR